LRSVTTSTTYDGYVYENGDEDPEIKKLLKNNRQWVADSRAADPDFFKKIGGKQRPQYLYVLLLSLSLSLSLCLSLIDNRYIGCSDSRVPANEILGLGPGEVFVHRNVGNLVIGSDLNVLSAIEFAVNFLEVKHIIVTGHYDCGAVHAAMTRQDLGLLENWIRHIRDVYRTHQSSLDMLSDDNLKHRRLVECSVVEQCLNVFKTGCVQRKRKEYRAAHPNTRFAYPMVHGMVFDPKEGLLKKLPINFKQIVSHYQHIYDLY
jgi:carbonic anhydrase